MSTNALSHIFRRWINRTNRPRTGTSSQHRPVRLRMEEVEQRLVPATLPAVDVSSTVAVANTTGAFQPQVVADPLNPNTLAMVVAQPNGILAQVSFDGGASWTKIRDTNTATGDPSRGKLLDPNLAISGVAQSSRGYTNVSAPSIAFSRAGTIYISYLEHNLTKTSGAMVVESFSLNRPTQAVVQNDLDPPRDWDNNPGTPPTSRFTRANPAIDNLANVLYQWVDNNGTTINRALNPYIAVDNNIPTYTDPQTGQVYTDALASSADENVYVVWNDDANTPTVNGYSTAVSGYNRNAVYLAASRNGGTDFTTPIAINDSTNAHFGTIGGKAPLITFSPTVNNVNGTVTPGQMSILWETTALTGINQIRQDIILPPADDGFGNTLPASSAHLFRSETYNSPTAASIIADAATGNVPTVTDFQIPVDLSVYPDFDTLTDMDVTIALTHNALSHLSIDLVSPDGVVVRLVENRINSAGNTRTVGGVNMGITGNDLGVAQGQVRTASQPNITGNAVGTVFSDQAPRQIHNPADDGTDYIGSFRPEAGSLSVFNGRTADQLSSIGSGRPANNPTGNWVLRITDVRTDGANPVPDRFLRFWSINFTSRVNNGGGTDRVLTTNTEPPLGTGADQTSPNQPVVSPTFGIGPGASVAYDNSLGSTSPYAGRMYLAYTGGAGTDTDIYLIYSDDNGATWSAPDRVSSTADNGLLNDDTAADNFSEGNRQQYMPTVTVDPATGTVVVMWYDARNDASNARVATYMATSIDGGDTFSPQTYLNSEKTAVDGVFRETVVLEPIPTNVAAMPTYNAGTYQYGGTGLRQAVVAYGGKIKPFWAGNLNAAGSSIFTATVATAAGPRVVSGDMGAVTLDSSDSDYGVYNTAAADGTRQLTGFLVTFDRPINSSTFTRDDVTVRFRAPGATRDNVPVNQTTLVPVLDPVEVPTTDGRYLYYVEFAAPQTAVGTYSYAIGPDVTDRVRSLPVAEFRSSDTPVPIPVVGTIESRIDVRPVAGNPVIGGGVIDRVQVGVSLNHTFDGDLTLTLIAPDGTRVILSQNNDGVGITNDNYLNTVFDDAAATPISGGSAPFTGFFIPDQPLSTLNGLTIDGTWRLEVNDDARGDSGTLLSWSLRFVDASGTLVQLPRSGNMMDQDADSSSGEVDNDTFSNPSSLSGAPFVLGQGGFDPATLPLILPGPHVVGTSVPNYPASSDNLVLNGTTGAVDVTFDRPMDPTSFSVNNILRMTGPVGDVPLTGATVTPVYATPQPPGTPTRTFRVTFPTQSLSGSYTIEFGRTPGGASVRAANLPQLVTVLPAARQFIDVTFDADTTAAAVLAGLQRVTGPTGAVGTAGATVASVGGSARTFRITFPDQDPATPLTTDPLPAGQYVVDFTPASGLRVAGSGAAVDSDFDAGLDVLRGDDPAATAFTTNAVPYVTTASAPIAAADVDDLSVSELPLAVTDDFIIRAGDLSQIQVRLDIAHADVRNLDIDLVAPSGTTVRLFSGDLLRTQSNPANFDNTLLQDIANDPGVSIQNALAPFSSDFGQVYAPQTPLAALFGEASLGTWRLRVTNNGTPSASSPAGVINGWALTLPRAVPGTGLGEAVADRFSAGFRISTNDPTNPQSRQVWTPVGPAPTNDQLNVARVSTVAVDPSDPSGNTVYVGVAGGGVWKTSNFLTTDAAGPRYVPLTDFGPSLGVNVSSIALFPVANDPNKTIVYALTGESNLAGDSRVGVGAGLLRSMDGGRTWQVLDSTTNVSAPGVVAPIDDTIIRDHRFAGAYGYKVIVDPKPLAGTTGTPVVYMAVSALSAQAAGVWRSKDGGDTWERVRAGQATDVALAAGSATAADGNLTRLYAAFSGTAATGGVYATDSALTSVDPNATGTGMTLLAGGIGNTSLVDVSLSNAPQATVSQPAGSTPNGAQGRISLAVPALTGDALQDFFLQDWVYALTGSGLYVTKDAGNTWTRAQLPTTASPFTAGGFGTNDESKADRSTLASNYTQAIAVSPLNPNIVYIAGSGDASLKVDITTMRDGQNFTFYNNSDPGITAANVTTTGTATGAVGGFRSQTATATFGGARGRVIQDRTTNTLYASDFLNLRRDYLNPFGADATVRIRGTGNPPPGNPAPGTNAAGFFVNDGGDTRWQEFSDILQLGDFNRGTTHGIVPVINPVTGGVRFLYATDYGIYTGVDTAPGIEAGTGTLSAGVGFSTSVSGSRNGNIQAAQLTDGATQTSQLAADLARVLFYGQGQVVGFPASGPDVVSPGPNASTGAGRATGDLEWQGPVGTGGQVVVDPSGTGTVYQWRNPFDDGADPDLTKLPIDFLRRFGPGEDQQYGSGTSITTGLLGPGGAVSAASEWVPVAGYSGFAVNPQNASYLMIGSPSTGRVFRSSNRGTSWGVAPVATAADLGGGVVGVSAAAFGASATPDTFMYVGTTTGRVYATTIGSQGSWANVSAGLSGVGPILRLVPNPVVGRRDLYAVTNSGVFYKADGTDTATPWQDITGTLFTITRPVFGNSLDRQLALTFLTSLAVDWRAAAYDAAGAPTSPPVLFAGGQGGVFRSEDNGSTWALYPSAIGDAAPVDGGYLPYTTVTDLDLSIGDFDTDANGGAGGYKAGGLNLLTATTFGRGTWAIRLAQTLPGDNTLSGPRVTQVFNPNPANGPSTRLQVQFSGPVGASALDPAHYRLTRPDGTAVTIAGVAPTIGFQNRYTLTFATSEANVGNYQLTVGYNSPTDSTPTISDPAGILMNQDGDATNGESNGDDQFVTSVFLNGTTTNSLAFVTPPSSATAGTSVAYTVQARNQFGTPLTTLTGPVTITVSDAKPTTVVTLADGSTFPATSPVTAQMENGVVTFRVSFSTAGQQSVAVAFNAPNTATPASTTTAVSAGAATRFDVTPAGASVAASSTPVSFTVTARDQFGNQATGYNLPVTVTRSGQPAVLTNQGGTSNPNAISVAVSNGVGTFTGTFTTRGVVGLTASGQNPANPAATIGGGTTVTVGAAAVARLETTLPAGPVTVGDSIPVVVRAYDVFNNPADLNGAVAVSSSDPAISVNPGAPVFNNGVATFTVTFGTTGTQTVTATAGVLSDASNPVTVQAVPPRPSTAQQLPGTYAVATGMNGSPVVQVFSSDGTLQNTFVPFPPGFNGQVDGGSAGFTGGIRVATGDVTGDNVPDYVVGTGPSITATVAVINGATGQTVFTYQPFESFVGGVFVSLGDIDRDGVNEIVITPDEGGGPRVVVLRGKDFARIGNFFGINDPGFRGGARAGVGDLNADGYADIVVSAGFGGGPRISIYDGLAFTQGRTVRPIGDFFLFDDALRNGAYIAVGDVDGDGYADIIGGAGPGGGPRVLVVSGQQLLARGAGAVNNPLANFFAGDTSNRGGVRVAVKNLDGDKFADIMVGAGEGGGSRVTAYRGRDLGEAYSFDAEGDYAGGVFVG